MKKKCGILAGIICCLLIGAAYGATDDLLGAMNEKLSRGTVNAVTGGIEIPASIIRGYDEAPLGIKPAGVVGGIFSGLWRFMGRTISGCMDLLTFWTAGHEDNAGVGIHMNNEYAWERSEETYRIFYPNPLEGAVIPVGKKVLRGSADLLGGILEVPGQILKGAKDGDMSRGVAKGLWYWMSREFSGIYDIGTAFLPTPKDNVGMSFDKKWPWSQLADSI